MKEGKALGQELFWAEYKPFKVSSSTLLLYCMVWQYFLEFLVFQRQSPEQNKMLAEILFKIALSL